MSDEELRQLYRRIAVHEAGHAVVAYAGRERHPVWFIEVSLYERDGHTILFDKWNPDAPDDAYARYILGGMAAEQLVLGSQRPLALGLPQDLTEAMRYLTGEACCEADVSLADLQGGRYPQLAEAFRDSIAICRAYKAALDRIRRAVEERIQHVLTEHGHDGGGRVYNVQALFACESP